MATAKIARIRKLLGIEPEAEAGPDSAAAADLNASLRGRRQKVGTEERVAAVLLSVALVERWKRSEEGLGEAASPPWAPPSVPVPLAPLPPAAARKARTRPTDAPEATAHELQQIDRLVEDVVVRLVRIEL